MLGAREAASVCTWEEFRCLTKFWVRWYSAEAVTRILSRPNRTNGKREDHNNCVCIGALVRSVEGGFVLSSLLSARGSFMAAAKEIADRYNITIEGNIPLTSRLLLGTQQDNMKYVVDLLECMPHHNLIISPGCDMPYATPVENVIGAAEAIRDVERTKLVLANYQAQDIDLSSVVIPDYASLDKPLMEVFTLDSAS